MAKAKEANGYPLTDAESAELAKLKRAYTTANQAAALATEKLSAAETELQQKIEPLVKAWDAQHAGTKLAKEAATAAAAQANDELRSYLVKLWNDQPERRTIEPGLVVSVGEPKVQPLTEEQEAAAVMLLLRKFPTIEALSPSLARSAAGCLKLNLKAFAELEAALQLHVLQREAVPVPKLNPKEWVLPTTSTEVVS